MTKKDYELIANCVSQQLAALHGASVLKEAQAPMVNATEALAYSLSKEFERVNSKFDRSKFLNACGI